MAFPSFGDNLRVLRLDEEVREIDVGLTRSQYRDRFELKQKWAVRPRDVQRSLLDEAPQIVHFSRHGVGEEGLALEIVCIARSRSHPTDPATVSGGIQLLSED